MISMWRGVDLEVDTSSTLDIEVQGFLWQRKKVTFKVYHMGTAALAETLHVTFFM